MKYINTQTQEAHQNPNKIIERKSYTYAYHSQMLKVKMKKKI